MQTVKKKKCKINFEKLGKEKCFVKNTNTLLHGQIQLHSDGWPQLEPRETSVYTCICVYVRSRGYCIFPSSIKSMKDETLLQPISPNPQPAGFTYTHRSAVLRQHCRRGHSPPHVVPYGAVPLTLPTTHTQIHFHWQIFWHTKINSPNCAILPYTRRLRIYGRFVDKKTNELYKELKIHHHV